MLEFVNDGFFENINHSQILKDTKY